MSAMPNGRQHSSQLHGNRPDDLTSVITKPKTRPSERLTGHSGRRLVVIVCGATLILWGAAYLAFRDWRDRYHVRADFGATQVAPVVDTLTAICPIDVDEQAWRQAVKETHSMLISVTGANLLDLDQLESLRRELVEIVQRARSRPETARDELAGIWNAMSERAEFVLQEGTSGRYKGHPRPEILSPRPAETRANSTGAADLKRP